MLQPERVFNRISDIDIQADICALGFTCLLLDIDNTLRSRETGTVPEDVLQWVRNAQQAGLSCCLLSNNWHHNVFEFARQLDLPLVPKAMKPLPFGYNAALKKMGARRGRALAIGDQLSTDVWGAHLAGVAAYLVEPLSSVDLKHTKVVRAVERAILKQHL